MMEKYIEAINAGKIVSVDWSSIEEMLGENIERSHDCSIYENDDSFPPQSKLCSDKFTEGQISQILRQSNVRFMADAYKSELPISPIECRYFSSVKPTSGPWLESPN